MVKQSLDKLKEAVCIQSCVEAERARAEDMVKVMLSELTQNIQ